MAEPLIEKQTLNVDHRAYATRQPDGFRETKPDHGLHPPMGRDS